jgi:hypothetical protein
LTRRALIRRAGAAQGEFPLLREQESEQAAEAGAFQLRGSRTMPSLIGAIALLLAALVTWRFGHGGVALALLALALCLRLSAYVRALRPPGDVLVRRVARPR